MVRVDEPGSRRGPLERLAVLPGSLLGTGDPSDEGDGEPRVGRGRVTGSTTTTSASPSRSTRRRARSIASSLDANTWNGRASWPIVHLPSIHSTMIVLSIAPPSGRRSTPTLPRPLQRQPDISGKCQLSHTGVALGNDDHHRRGKARGEQRDPDRSRRMEPAELWHVKPGPGGLAKIRWMARAAGRTRRMGSAPTA